VKDGTILGTKEDRIADEHVAQGRKLGVAQPGRRLLGCPTRKRHISSSKALFSARRRDLRRWRFVGHLRTPPLSGFGIDGRFSYEKDLDE
jgi:hypothetical protein